jgi:uncharacterized protein YidB (DUF937 family)
MSRGPSMTALLGLLAVAGYQNRDKIAEWIGGMQGGSAAGGAGSGGGLGGGFGQGAGGAPGGGMGQGGGSPAPAGLDRLLPSGGGGGLGSLIHDGLSGLMDQFKQAGHGEVAESWVGPGPNKTIAPPELERAIGHDTLSTLSQQTGLSREELLARLSRELPSAVDRYTPDGRLPAA